jgi:hypothetical protein
MMQYWFTSTSSSWEKFRAEIELELEDYNIEFNNNKNCSRKQTKKRDIFKKRKHITDKVKQRVVQDDTIQDVDSAVLEAIIWGDQYLRYKLSQTYGNKRKNASEVRSRFIKQRQGGGLPVPEWSWEDVRRNRTVPNQQTGNSDRRRVVL